MPVINLAVNYDDIKDLDEFVVVPGGTYQFTVKNVTEKNSQAGRPMLNWQLEVIDPATARPVTVFHTTVLPWMHNGEMDVKGCGMLVSVAKAVGMPWTGQSLATEDYIGRSGSVMLKVTKIQRKDPATNAYVDDPEGKERNEVEKFIY